MLHKTTPERISEMLDLVHSKGEQYIQQNPYSEYQEIAYKAKLSGLIRKKTDEEIAEELKGKPWLKINKIIRHNEDRNNSTTDPSNHSS